MTWLVWSRQKCHSPFTGASIGEEQDSGMDIDRRSFLAASGASALVPARSGGATRLGLTPEEFGARGDGVTNDTQAFARLCAQIQRQGGGTISLRPGRTYIVGAQAPGGGPAALNPLPIIHLDRLRSPLLIAGNGASLRAQPGLRFGTFDIGSGQRVDHPMPNLDRKDLAIPYRAMIWVSNCTAPVEIRDVELDGNVDRLNVGGKFGDKGWQVPANGFLLQLNQGPETLSNILSHHHALDGGAIVGAPERTSRSRITKLVARDNGRQGVSITAGRGYDFADCEFSRSGRGKVHSAPAAGVDIEGEHKRPIRDLSFTRCRFSDNAGCGLVADSGDSEGVRFSDCTFVGTTNWSAWPRKPRFSFTGCTFVGSIVHAFADPDPSRAAHFTNCRFTDDPKLSPTGEVYAGKARGGPIANLAESENVSFDACNFDLVGSATLPLTKDAIYRDCTMRQKSSDPGRPRGRFVGRTSIAGNVDIAGSSIEGSVILNGRELRGKLR